jgi:hypothetical protein
VRLMGWGRRALAILAACTLVVVALSLGFPSPSEALSADPAAPAATRSPARPPLGFGAGEPAFLDVAGPEGESTGAFLGFVVAALAACFVAVSTSGLPGRSGDEPERSNAVGSWAAAGGRGPPAPLR